MRRSISKVIDAWKAGKAADGDSKQTCSTDGTTIWSYNLPIATRNKLGQILIIPRKSTRTTEMQISAVQTSCSEWDGNEWHKGYFEVNNLWDHDEDLVAHDVKILATG